MSAACRHVVRADLAALEDVFVGAFAADPLYGWLYPDAGERPGRLAETFGLIASAALARGHLYTNAARTALAGWTAPDVPLLDERGGEAFIAMLERHIGPRTDEAVAGMAATDRHRPSEPHFALHSLAVHPAAQGRGVAASLVAPVLARCDEDGLRAHLDSSSPRNVPFYARLGFEVRAEERLGPDGPVMRTMVRPPG